MFPSDEVRKKVLYHVGLWLMAMITVTFFIGDPTNALHSMFLEQGLQLIAWLVIGVVFNTAVEVGAAAVTKNKGS